MKLRKLLGYIERPELIKAMAKVQKPGPRTNIAEPEEIQKLMLAAPPWLKLILMLASHGGLRRSDCLRIAPQHYDRQRKLITIQQQKTGQTVQLPVPPQLAAALEAIPTINENVPFYEAMRGKPISNEGLTAAYQRTKKAAGVRQEVWIHDLRRTLAVSLYELSKDLRVVEQMLGHRSLSSTAHYLEHRDPEKLRSLINELWKPTTEKVQ